MATRHWPPTADQVIEGFIRWLNKSEGASYEIAERPDTTERTLPAIDYVLRDTKTGRRCAVEVSSIWRSKEAGMEDAYIDKWFQRARKVVAGRVPGKYYITLPIRVPQGVEPERFGEALVKTIAVNQGAIAREGQQGKHLRFTIEGMEIAVFLLPLNAADSDIEYARYYPEMADFPTRVRACLDEKAPKLKPYSDAGIETWIAIFNTMGIAMSLVEAKRIIEQECGPRHAHVSHIVLVLGNPPDDVWVQVIR
jgi:hypothetical protein